jgi:hypothetical protein
MWYRRALHRGQFLAAIVLPIWVLVSRGLIDDGVGWQLLGYLIACPILFVSMAAVGGVISARPSVRETRAVSALDAALLSAWYLVIFSYGLWASSLLAVAVLLVGLALFWLAVVSLVRDTRARLQVMMAGFEQAAQQGPGTPFGPPFGAALDNEPRRIIVINPDDDASKN